MTRDETTAAAIEKILASGNLPPDRRKLYEDSLRALRGANTPAAAESPTKVTPPKPAVKAPEAKATTTKVFDSPRAVDDPRLKLPPRYRAVWRVLYRWAGSSRRPDRQIEKSLTDIARSLRGEWGGFSTRQVRSAVEYLGKVTLVDVKSMPAAKAEPKWRQRGGDGQFKETPVVVRVPLVSEIRLKEAVARITAMPPDAKVGDPKAAARARRYRVRKASTYPVTHKLTYTVTSRPGSTVGPTS